MKTALLAFLLAASPLSEYLVTARQEIDARRYDNAIRRVMDGLLEHPGVPDLLSLLGEAYEARARVSLEAGDADSAERDLAQALAAAPERHERIETLLAGIEMRRIGDDLARGNAEGARRRLVEIRRGRPSLEALRPLAGRVYLALAETAAVSGRDYEAIQNARRALLEDTSLIQADLLLARLYYAREEMDLARSHLADAQAKAAGRIAGIQAAIDRIEQEAAASRSYSAIEAGGVRVLFEGATRPELFQIALPTLQESLDRAARLLEHRPVRPVTVILYTSDDFVRGAHAPDWAGGIYDGKVRIRGGEVIRAAALRRIARHEMAHAVLEEMSPGRFPAWVHEGVAQTAEVDDWEPPPGAHELAMRVRRGEWIPFAQLETPFARNSAVSDTPARVALAYAEGAAAIAFLRRMYGPGKLIAFLQALAAGAETPAAIREATFLTPELFEAKVRDYVIWEYAR